MLNSAEHKIFIFFYFSFYEQLDFVLSWVENEKSWITSGTDDYQAIEAIKIASQNKDQIL